MREREGGGGGVEGTAGRGRGEEAGSLNPIPTKTNENSESARGGISKKEFNHAVSVLFFAVVCLDFFFNDA